MRFAYRVTAIIRNLLNRSRIEAETDAEVLGGRAPRPNRSG
jgi:hypothetical protein